LRERERERDASVTDEEASMEASCLNIFISTYAAGTERSIPAVHHIDQFAVPLLSPSDGAAMYTIIDLKSSRPHDP
jgi:hypothetical protein